MEKDSLLYRIKEGLSDTCYIWVKEMRSTITDEGVLIFCILVPLLYPLLYSWIYNNEVVREVPVAVVDLSHSSLSRQFIRNFDASPDTRVAYYCSSLDEAKELTGKQQVHGTLLFPENFDTKVNRHEQTMVSVYADMSLMLTYKAIFQTAQAVSTKLNSGIQLKQVRNYTDRDDEVTTKPLDFDEIPIFNTTGGYGNAILPGVLMLILQQTLLLGIGLAAGTARENNRYQDLVPISKHYNGIFRIVLGKSMCYFMLYAVMGTYLALVVPRLFHYISLVSAETLAGLLLPYILSCIFFGMMLSCLVRYRENVMLLVVFTSVPFLFMTGLSWPQSNMPGFWQGIAYLIPSTFGVRGFLRISSMGASLSDIQVEYQALWIQVFVYFLLTCAVYRYQINTTRKRAFDHMQRLKEKAQEAKARKSQSQPTSSPVHQGEEIPAQG
ncbi:MAG: ABC transporter permease [Prevotella sp.]|nr:ABC transporter permease [Prevotella sp.]